MNDQICRSIGRSFVSSAAKETAMVFVIVAIAAAFLLLAGAGAIRCALYLLRLCVAVAIASAVTSVLYVLVLMRIDAVLAGGWGLIDIPAALMIWLGVFGFIRSAGAGSRPTADLP